MEVIMKREILSFDVNQEDFLLSMVDLVDLIIKDKWGPTTLIDDGPFRLASYSY